MAGGLITDDFQFEYNGLLFGGDTGYEIVSSNLFDLPALRTSDVNRPQRDGQFAGNDLMAGKSIVLQLEAWASDGTDMGARVAAIMEAFSPGTTHDLVTQIPSMGQIKLECRVRRRSLPLNIDQIAGLQRFSVELYAVNPIWQSNTQKAVFIGLGSVSGGLSFPISFPISFGETNVGASSMTNSGTYDSFPLVVIVGPITDPTLENRTVGKTLTFTGTLAVGEQLWVDFDSRTVLLDNSASRYNWVDDSSQFWSLVPGTNEVWLGGTAGAGTPVALAAWRDAWV